ncbi:YbjN domain-containing protein [Corynebacterium sanguinis]|uniref:YbjN domain-containing protein n=1 Tax=Corynebacterium sanguinis TaxID=2594913 RepID=UPI00223C3754|nr:YbjN domain-containing protein [Corynebacterium sanguinis]MCT1613031.1 YbjN domain-containing protein [Corynebacterium sanguinis]
MGKHSAQPPYPDESASSSEVTLKRIVAALDGLGLSPMYHPDRPDRAVVPAYAFVSTVWISYDKPLMLVADFTERVPTEFERSAELADFINEWNRDRVGPTASYRLMDSGDLAVSLRAGVRTRCGLTDEQLMAELADAFEHAAAFSTQLRQRFLPIEFDQPLPPALARAQDADALLGRHPSERHLPRGEHRQFSDIHDVPDVYDNVDDEFVEPVDLDSFTDTLDMLDFTYDFPAEDLITTGVNSIAFAVCIDAGEYARVTAMWDTGQRSEDGFLAMWLICNDLNEQTAGLRAYLLDLDGDLHLHVETTCLVSQGLSPAQRHNYLISSFVSILGAVDQISTQVKGASAVNWPGRAEG